MLNQATLNLVQAYDWKNGGWGKSPKFPQPMTIEYLLRRSTADGRATGNDKLVVEMVVHALRAMAKGGMYDVVGGGFSRYSWSWQRTKAVANGTTWSKVCFLLF